MKGGGGFGEGGEVNMEINSIEEQASPMECVAQWLKKIVIDYLHVDFFVPFSSLETACASLVMLINL